MNIFKYFNRSKNKNSDYSIKQSGGITLFCIANLFVSVLISIFAINYNNQSLLYFSLFIISVVIVFYINNYFVFNHFYLYNILNKEIKEENDDLIITFCFTYKKDYKPLFYLNIGQQKIQLKNRLINDINYLCCDYKIKKDNFGKFKIPNFKVFTFFPMYCRINILDFKLNGNNFYTVLPKIHDFSYLENVFSDEEKNQKNNSSKNNDNYSLTDIESLKEIQDNDLYSKISWKQSLKRDKLITFIFEKESENSFIINWPNSGEDRENIKKIYGLFLIAVKNNKKFKVNHPEYSSEYGRTLEDAKEIISKLIEIVLPLEE